MKKILSALDGREYGDTTSISYDVPREVADSLDVIESNIDKISDVRLTLKEWCDNLAAIAKKYSTVGRESRVAPAVNDKDIAELRELFIACDHWNMDIEEELSFAISEFQDSIDTIADNLQDIRDYFVDNDMI